MTTQIIPLLFIFIFFISSPVIAQESTGTNGNKETSEKASPSLKALKLNSPNEIILDGNLDEVIWQQAPIATDFIQRAPNEGEPATEKTEVRVIYSDEALFVGIKAYDSAMDSLAATLFRKDGSAYSDWVYVDLLASNRS